MENFIEAHRLFRSRDFYDVIKYEEPRIKALYDNIRKWSLGEQAMEEFLVGIKQKECIFLTMGRNQRTFRNLKEATREIIHFTKNTWGFMPVKVHVSGDFIQIGRDTLQRTILWEICLISVISFIRKRLMREIIMDRLFLKVRMNR